MNQDTRRNERLLIGLILTVAAIFRFYPFGEVSFSNDELSALIRTRYPSFSEMIRGGVYSDFHPAGVQSFLYCWTNLLGENAFLLRLPFIMFGLGSTWLIYRLGSRWFHAAAGLLAAAMFSVLEYSIIYSQLARPYAPGLFFCLLSTWYWTNLYEESLAGRIRRQTWIGWTLSMAVCTHLHYFSLVYAAALGLWGFTFIKGSWRPIYALTGLVIVLLALPEWTIFQEQLKTGDLGGWLGKPEPTWLFSFFFNVFNASWLLIDSLIVCFFTGWYVQRSRPVWNRFHNAVAFLFLFSFGLAFGYSLLRHPIIQYSTLFFVFPLLLLFFFSFTPNVFRQGTGLVLVVVLVLLGGGVSTALEKKFFRMPAYGVFKELADRTRVWSVDAPKPAVVVLNVINPDYLDYYFDQADWKPERVIYRPETAGELARLMVTLDSIQPQSVIYGWTNSFHPEELYFLLRERWPIMDQDEAFFNARISRFRKSKDIWPEPGSRALVWDYEQDEQAVYLPDSFFAKGKVERMISGREFSHTLECDLDSLHPSGYDVLHARCRFLSGAVPPDALLVVSIEKEKNNLAYFSATLSDWTIKPGKWQEAIISGIIPEGCTGGKVKAYVWNKGAGEWWLDDLALALTPAPYPYEKP